MQDRTSFCLRSSEDRKNRGKGIKKMSRSDERLTTRFVMRWFKYVAHWAIQTPSALGAIINLGISYYLLDGSPNTG
jgi:hypothetical protein